MADIGAQPLWQLAGNLSLTEPLCESMAPTKQRRRGHDSDEVLVEHPVAFADEATAISDLRVLADPAGDVASVPTRQSTGGSRANRLGATGAARA